MRVIRRTRRTPSLGTAGATRQLRGLAHRKPSSPTRCSPVDLSDQESSDALRRSVNDEGVTRRGIPKGCNFRRSNQGNGFHLSECCERETVRMLGPWVNAECYCRVSVTAPLRTIGSTGWPAGFVTTNVSV